MTKTQIPKYVERAITSELARTEPYSWLSQEEWRDIAEHVYRDERVPNEQGIRFLQRGTQNSYGRSVRKTLNGILSSAVVDHAGVIDQVPHYWQASRLYEVVEAARTLKGECLEIHLIDIGK